MIPNVEETLSRELHQVADGLQVPQLPELPQEPASRGWHRHPLLVAAAVALIVAGAVAAATMRDGGDVPDPAPAPPTPTPSRTSVPLTADAPTVPYVLDGRLFVRGEQVPGTWWAVKHAGSTWVAHRDDDTWWWGTDTEPIGFEGTVILEPQLSPDGSLVAVATTADDGEVILFEAGPDGETIGELPFDWRDPGSRDRFGVVAVTDDVTVILQGVDSQLLWRGPDGGPVDFGASAPDQWVRQSTPAGLVVFDGRRDGEDDATYLADVSDSGELIPRQTVPGEDVVVNPSGTWLAHGGSWGGEAPTIPTIEAQTIDGRQHVTLDPPHDGELLASTWEDDDLLLAETHRGGTVTGLARCSVREGRCVVVETD
jgi:hypothetical protein